MSPLGTKISKSEVLPPRAIALCLFILLLLPLVLNGETRRASVDGDWNSPATWGNNPVPGAGDDVIINASRTVTITENAACTSITFNNASTLTFDGAFTLNVSGAVTLPSATNNNPITFDLGAGTANIGGLFRMNGGSGNASRVNNLTISTGTLNLNGGFTTATIRSNVIFNSNGTLNISGAVSSNAMTLTPGTGTVNYIGSTAQNIWILNYYKLGIAGTATKTCTGILTATNALSVASGGTLALPAAGSPLNYTGVISGTGKVLYSSGSAQNISNATYHNLEFSGAGTKTIAASTIQIGGNLIAGSTTSMTTTGGANVTGNISGAGNITMATGTISLEGNWTNSGTFTPVSGTVHYDGTNQSIASLPYFNLQTSGSGTKTLSANTQVNNILTISSPSILNLSVHTLTLPLTGSPLVNSGTISGTGIVLYSGGGNQTVTGTTYPNLSFSGAGAKTISAGTTVTVTGNWVVGSSTTMTATAGATVGGNISGAGAITMGSGTINIAGSWTNNGSFTRGTGTINYNGATQTIPALTYHNLQTSNSGVKTLAANTSVEGVLTINALSGIDLSTFTLILSGSGTPLVVNLSGTFTPSSSTVNFTNPGSTNVPALNYFNLNLSGGIRVLANSGVIGVASVFTPGGGGFTVTGSTISFNGSGAQTIPAFTFHDLVLSGSGARVIQSPLIVSVNGIEIQDGPTLDIEGSAEFRINKP